jgi:hypothetical protein
VFKDAIRPTLYASASIAPRSWVGLALAVCILIGTVVNLRDRSLLWFVPLQGFGIAALYAGVPFLVHAIFGGWHKLATGAAALSAVYVALAIAVGWLVRHSPRSLLRLSKGS